MEKVNYYEVGSIEDIVISNTSLSYINPKQGGSPAKFLNFFEKFIEFKNSISLERGSLLHDFHEHEDKFVISDVKKPSEMMASWVERVFNAYKPSGIPIEQASLPMNFIAYRGGAYSNLVDTNKVSKRFVDDGLDYLKFLYLADGKIAMTSATKEIVVKSMAALKGHRKANHMLFGELPNKVVREKELEVYWEVNVKGYEKPVKFKAKLDNTIFDYNKKIAYLNDLKSTSDPVSLFKQSFSKYRYYRQLSFYVKAIFQYLIQQGEDPDTWEVLPRIIAVDSTPFYNVHCFTIDPKWTELGYRESEELVNRVIWHLVHNEWKYTAEEVDNKYDCHIDYDSKDGLFNEDATGTI